MHVLRIQALAYRSTTTHRPAIKSNNQTSPRTWASPRCSNNMRPGDGPVNLKRLIISSEPKGIQIVAPHCSSWRRKAKPIWRPPGLHFHLEKGNFQGPKFPAQEQGKPEPNPTTFRLVIRLRATQPKGVGTLAQSFTSETCRCASSSNSLSSKPPASSSAICRTSRKECKPSQVCSWEAEARVNH